MPTNNPQLTNNSTDRAAVVHHADCKLQDKCFLSVGATDANDAYKKVGLGQQLRPLHCWGCQLATAGRVPFHPHMRSHSRLWSACGLQVQRKLVIACVLCFIFMIVEIVGGYIAKRWVAHT